jgi:hypothetical protein
MTNIKGSFAAWQILKRKKRAIMSTSLPEFLEDIEQRYGKDMAENLGLVVDGILFRESPLVIARYTHFPIKAILTIQRNIRTNNNLDYFTV